MILRNKLDKPFNPSAVAAGYFILIAGLATVIKGYGIIFILLGAFMAFTYTSTEIDLNANKYRLVMKLFGFIPQGKWKSMENFSRITLMKSNKVYRSYSRSNRQLTGKILDYRIVALDGAANKKIPLQKCKTKEEAIQTASKLSKMLRIPINNS